MSRYCSVTKYGKTVHSRVVCIYKDHYYCCLRSKNQVNQFHTEKQYKVFIVLSSNHSLAHLHILTCQISPCLVREITSNVKNRTKVYCYVYKR